MTAGATRGHKYLDRLHVAARRKATQILAPDVARALASIRQGQSFDDIKARLISSLKQSDRKQLETLMYRAGMLAALAGHDAASLPTLNRRSK